jgi:dihydroorotate dehydrogenase
MQVVMQDRPVRGIFPFHLFRKMLERCNAETAHHVSLKSLQFIYKIGLTPFFFPPLLKKSQATTVMGISFPNPVGLAAGMDKNGDYIEALASLGFGFIEIGTVTPKPQEGNAKPRLFRLIPQQAIINRMGFNNKGCDYVVTKLKQTKFHGVLGINIGKNFTTPLEQANNDYVHVFRQVAPYASYVTLNVSSPNTQSLRDLQHGELLRSLLQTMKLEQQSYHQQHKKYVPLVVKIAPDMTQQELQTFADIALQEKIDGIIATNTTISRVGVEHVSAAGGLSGKPLAEPATAVIKDLQTLLQGRIPIIASGGVHSIEAAQQKIAAGASLVQLYTILIYRGPMVVNEVVASLALPPSLKF